MPNILPRLSKIKIKSPIEQNFQRGGGLPSGTFRQLNFEKKKTYSVQEWYNLSQNQDYAGPIKDETGTFKQCKREKDVKKRKRSIDESNVIDEDKENQVEVINPNKYQNESIKSNESLPGIQSSAFNLNIIATNDALSFPNNIINTSSHQQLETTETFVSISESVVNQEITIDDHQTDFTFSLTEISHPVSKEVARDLEKFYWKNISYSPPMYGADLMGTLFRKEDANSWDPGRLDNVLNNLRKKIPGVNVPYLYFGLWKSTFAWHVVHRIQITFI